MCDVELPHLVLGAELGRLEEELLHHGVVVSLPVDACLRHQHRYVPLQLLVVLLQADLYCVVVPSQARVLDLLREAAQLLDVLGGQFVELAVRFLHRGGHHDARVHVVVLLLAEVLVRQVGVFCQQAGRDVVILVLAVQQQKVAEGLGRVGRVGEQVGELLEGARGVLLVQNDGLVVQRYGVQLRLQPGRHVRKGLLGGAAVRADLGGLGGAHLELHCGLEVERLHQAGLLQHGTVAH
mmetsp:Transcript_9142/g.19899  ORF Transcript_9142/g.19899 Transcript_9142/m.19899 type:complete len:238 (+) Transcript_9142:651-1364(+)